jgi:hypothetical protein
MHIIRVVRNRGSAGVRASGACRWHAWIALIVSLLAMASPPAFAEHFKIVYPRASNRVDGKAEFIKALIQLAMSETHSDCTIEPSHDVMERSRALRELADGKTVNLHWASMSASDEANLRPIRIPLYRGLIGLRVFIIRKDRQPDFDRIDDLDQLKTLTAGQGFSWVDAGILRNAGLKVETSTYDLLFNMTEAGRVDYFPRGLVEAGAEVAARRAADPDLVVENHLLLAYRSDFIFYTNKQNERLAETLEKGLAAAYEDGSYMRLFNSDPYVQNALVLTAPARRKIIWLPNPYLSAADRQIPDKYWMSLTE